MKIIIFFLVLTFLFFQKNTPLQAWQNSASPEQEEVFLTPDAALKIVFPKAEKIVPKEFKLTELQKRTIEKKLGWKFQDQTYTVYEGYRLNQRDGFAMIAEEIGKFKPITFIVKVSEKGEVERVEVLIYRESVGSEVRRQRFAGQYKGKTSRDPIQLHRDIINITGATMSAQALSAGVKKVLALLDVFYFNKS